MRKRRYPSHHHQEGLFLCQFRVLPVPTLAHSSEWTHKTSPSTNLFQYRKTKHVSSLLHIYCSNAQMETISEAFRFSNSQPRNEKLSLTYWLQAIMLLRFNTNRLIRGQHQNNTTGLAHHWRRQGHNESTLISIKLCLPERMLGATNDVAKAVTCVWLCSTFRPSQYV